MGKRKRRGLLLALLGAVLMSLGAFVICDVGDGLQYILPAPAASKESGELTELYKAGQEQLAALTDSLTAAAIGARAQGMSVSAGDGRNVETALYAVGAGYFDVTHETLLSGRLISETDVRKADRVIVLDERSALALFPGDDPLGREVTLEGVKYEVAGVFRGGRRLGETDEHISYIPITTAGDQALAMQTVEILAKGSDSIASAILMEDTLRAWKPGGSFYHLGKLAMGAAMPLRWLVLIVGGMVLLSLLARLNAHAWGRICRYAELLRTRYARDMLPAMAGNALACLVGYAALLGAAFALASFAIQPLYVFTEWVPEVVVELSSLTSRFWSLNNQNAAAVRYVSRGLCQLELGQGLLRWGLMAALLGAAVYGVPWLNRRIELPRMKRER